MSQQNPQPLVLDPQRLAESLKDVALRSQKLVANYLSRPDLLQSFADVDPFALAQTYQEIALRVMNNPASVMEAQIRLWSNYISLMQRTLERTITSKPVEPVAKPNPEDKRFKDEMWVDNVIFDFIKQSYLLTADFAQGMIKNTEGVDEKTRRKAAFYTRQWVDALSPSNFVATNPEVLKATIESGGDNLYRGMVNLLKDMERGDGQLRISMTDYDAFKLGENVAITPGKVVYQNDMMQLLQYTPTTETVYKLPLLIIPPWINKFYILDLKPKNSFIRWAVEQGHTVFVISWINPDESYAKTEFSDYMFKGPLEALDLIKKATGEDKVNTIGYCLGGTLLACMLSYMASKGDDRIVSATYFTSLLDFTEVGDLQVFIDEGQISKLEGQMERKGYLDGRTMADAFNMLRANDLIWSFVVNNYLMGRDPASFDLLYWNSDSTRMPATMHGWYLRNMYLNNNLSKPGAITLGGVPIDLSRVKVPSYYLSTREDHIAPWKSTYAGARLLSSDVHFTLGASGHIAGVINPPSANKYAYWTNGKPGLPADPNEWLATAVRHEGSWWSDWNEWAAQFAGEQVPARTPGAGELPALEDAPGAYVKVRL